MNNKAIYNMLADAILNHKIIAKTTKGLLFKQLIVAQYPFIKIHKITKKPIYSAGCEYTQVNITIDALSNKSDCMECIGINDAMIEALTTKDLLAHDTVESIQITDTSIAKIKNTAIWRGRINIVLNCFNFNTVH